MAEKDMILENDHKIDYLLERMEDINDVLENAATTALLMSYMHRDSKDINSILFYSVVRKYEMMCQTKDDMRNYQYFNLEIFTVFIHSASILKVPIVNSAIVSKIVDNLASETCINHYLQALNEMKNTVLKKVLDEYRYVLGLGDDPYALDALHDNMNRDDELELLKRVQSDIRNSLVRQQKSRCLPLSPGYRSKKDVNNIIDIDNCSNESSQRFNNSILDHEIRAKIQSLSTQIEYFQMCKKYSYFCKFNHISNNQLLVKSFLNNYTKTIKKIKKKGHVLHEQSPVLVKSCSVCDIIIWGSFPMCYYCDNCRSYFHQTCKDNIIDCSQLEKKQKKEKSIQSPVTGIKRRPSKGFEGIRSMFGITEEPSVPRATTPVENNNNLLRKPSFSDVSITSFDTFADSNEEMSKLERTNRTSLFDGKSAPPRISETSERSSIGQELDQVSLDNQSERTVSEKSINSLQKKLEQISNSDIEHVKSAMNLKNMTEKADAIDIGRSKSSRSDQPRKVVSSRSKSQTRINSETVQQNPVLQTPQNRRSSLFTPFTPVNYSHDDEMNITEQFDAEIEIVKFPKLQKKIKNGKKDKSYHRVLTIMELFHKIKYIRMFFKRLHYMLVEPWIELDEHMDLFDQLSLHSIDRLYSLLNDLVKVMEKCTNESGFDPFTARTFKIWLTEDDNSNLFHWSRLSMDLFCTNILKPVEVLWREQQRQNTPLSQILNQKVNKLILVEQLTNMRPLFLSIPQIAYKLAKEFSDVSTYKEEQSDWTEIFKSFVYLPKSIDEKCVPIIELINCNRILNGISKQHRIASTSTSPTGNSQYNGAKLSHSNSNTSNSGILPEKSKDEKELIRKFVANFPKTFFQRNFIDFQCVKLTSLSESRFQTPSTAYVREEMDVAVIFYENMLVILQKENEKFILRNFKNSSSEKFFPVFTLDQLHSTKKNICEGQYELTIVMIKQAVLIQLVFKNEKERDKWHEYASNIKSYQTSALNYQSSGASDYAEIIDEKMINSIPQSFRKQSSLDTTEESCVPESFETIENIDEADYEEIDEEAEAQFQLIQNSLENSVRSLDEAKELLNQLTSRNVEEEVNETKTNPVYNNTFVKDLTTLMSSMASLTSDMIAQSRPSNSLVTQKSIELHLEQFKAISGNINNLINDFNFSEINSEKKVNEDI